GCQSEWSQDNRCLDQRAGGLAIGVEGHGERKITAPGRVILAPEDVLRLPCGHLEDQLRRRIASRKLPERQLQVGGESVREREIDWGRRIHDSGKGCVGSRESLAGERAAGEGPQCIRQYFNRESARGNTEAGGLRQGSKGSCERARGE